MDALSTGVGGLDEIMRGGLRPKSMHLIVGPPGVGKTVLAQQIGFHHACLGRTVLYLTALSETVESLIAHLQSLTFSDSSLVAKKLYYMSIYSELQTGGLTAVLDEIRRLVREYKADVVLVDGLRTLKYAATDPLDFRRFLFNLNAQLSSLGATTAFISANDSVEDSDPESTVADGIIYLYRETVDGQMVRFIEVPKLRNEAHLTGRHSFTIGAAGLTVYPRLEAVMLAEGLPSIEESTKRSSTGVDELDRLLSGGLPAGSVTLVVGDSGSGRTLMGLSFLAQGAREGEKGLYFGFHEAPMRLLRAADGIGLGLSAAVDAGAVVVSWRPLLDPIPDRLAWDLIATVKEHNIKRVFLDGLCDVLETISPVERLRPFLSALNDVLRGLGVTTMTSSLPLYGYCRTSLLSSAVESTVDNTLLLRYVESGPHFRRLVSIVKMREGEYDSTVHEFTISKRGLEVTKPFDPDSARPVALERARGRRGNG